MSHTERLKAVVGELVDGWSERIDYFDRIVAHAEPCMRRRMEASPGKLKHWACLCPVGISSRTVNVCHVGLLAQLDAECSGWAPSTMNSMSGGRPQKPKSKPPTTLDTVDLVGILDKALANVEAEGPTHADRLRWCVRVAPMCGDEWTVGLCVELERFARGARVILGYDGEGV